jgi:hypothetical protein
MKILHIIPSAFDYFDDIKRQAFETVEDLEQAGVDIQVVTLQYGSVTKSEKSEVAKSAPSREYLGQISIEESALKWSEYGIVHLHCPFFGAGKLILNWKKEHQNIPLFITYYNDFATTDFFSIILKIYNLFYLPKIFRIADKIIFACEDKKQCACGAKIAQQNGKLAILKESTDSIAEITFVEYNKFLNNLN